MASEVSEHGRSVNQRVTIREVAAKADVALSSVSRALSGHPDVSDEMRKRVKEVADELGYEPNLVAQSLRSGVTRTIGFVVRDINNPMFGLEKQVPFQNEHWDYQYWNRLTKGIIKI